MMEVASLRPGANGQAPGPSPSPHLDPEILLQHLVSLLRITLEAATEDLEAKGSLLSDTRRNDSLQRCSRFASESQVVLYMQKDLALAVNSLPNGHGGNESYTRYIYSLSGEISNSASTVASVALIKRPQPLDLRQSLSSQIQVINLPGTATLSETNAGEGQPISPYEVLHSIVHLALTPYFNAHTRGQNQLAGSSGRADTDAKGGVPGAKKRLADLELSLRHLQQNIEIPELVLQFPDIIQAALDDAAAQGLRPSIDSLDSSQLTDSAFLNDLQSHVNNWIKSIQAIAKLSRDVDGGSALQEINYWLNLEVELKKIDKQTRNDGVQMTLDILQHAKRYQAKVSFLADTGLKEALDTVSKYNQLMRDFPMDDLLTATTLQKTREALDAIFNHLNKKLRFTSYPIHRALPLVHAISSDLDSQIHELLKGRTLMHLEYKEFVAVMDVADSIWATWDEHAKDFTNVAREQIRKKGEKFLPIKVVGRHLATQDRMTYVKTFRTNHEQLQRTIITVLGNKDSHAVTNDGKVEQQVVLLEEIGDIDAVQEVSQAYASLKDVDVLDVSPEGTQIWIQAETTYHERTARVENSIIARLRDRLATAKTASEMFRVFDQFNALFVRPKIRGAISEYQTQLIDNVKRDITELQERFKSQYGNSEAHTMAQLRDMPPIAGAIVWARQIEQQLNGLMRKVESVLGQDWALHSEGQKLEAESTMFREKLDTRPVFENWLRDVQRRQLSINGMLFKISKNRALGNALEISVSFDSQVIVLFKEVRNLIWLNHQIPHAINSVSKEAKRVYPFAVSLIDSCRTLNQTVRAIDSLPSVSVLLSGYVKDVQSLTATGLTLRWESFVHSYDRHNIQQSSYSAAQSNRGALSNRTADSHHVQFVRSFAAKVSLLQDKTSALQSIHETIEEAMADLQKCPYQVKTFQSILNRIQDDVDQLILQKYANINFWVGEINRRIEALLQDRLQDALHAWVESFQDFGRSENDSPRDGLDESVQSGGTPSFQRLVLEILMRNQVVYLDPPTEHARAAWLQQLHVWIGVICDLPLLNASRFEMTLDSQASRKPAATFSHLCGRSMRELSNAYTLVEDKHSELSSYVEKWLQFQSLWDLESDFVYSTLGDDLSKWLQLLQEIRRTRETFDTSESNKVFGTVTVDYEQVQSKITGRYDQWQQELRVKFAGRLGMRMREVYTEIEKARRDLEGQSLEASSTAQAVSFITVVQRCRRKIEAWEPEIEVFRQGQILLSRQRHQFPSDWLHVDQIDNEWALLRDILDRKTKIVNEQTDALRAKILAEDKVVSEKVGQLITEWGEEKPISGSIPPGEASRTLKSFETRLTNLQNELEMVMRAKEALDLPSDSDDRMEAILEEVRDFSAVWAGLSTVWNSLNDIRDSPWQSVQPRKTRQALDGLLKMLADMPSKMRSYAAFEHIQTVLKGLLKAIPLLSDMKSDAVRERHWVKIFKALRPNKRYSSVSMTLGDVWDLQLGSTEKAIREIITQAQGEMALEEFLKQIRDTWTNYDLELVNYQNRCRIIKGIEELLASCSENLNALQAMRHSAHYKQFEEEASSWEDKLNRVHVLFDVWIDVQRQWVYLEGVFTGNADIKHLLPVESSRFQNINSEFFAVMKKVYKSPAVLDVLNISGVQKSLERLADLLHKIQKALGEYLEKERASFPRFYFVGDEDLLEIIGNSNDTMRVSKHFKKMFAGLSGLKMEDETIITAFTSKEGELVPFKKPISLTKTPKINDWLAALESNMKSTLAELLTEAFQAFQSLVEGSQIDVAQFQSYMNEYPAQIVVLATQVVWTSQVDAALASKENNLSVVHSTAVRLLEILASTVLGKLDPLLRKKCEHLITEFVHQRDVVARLQQDNAKSPLHYLWLLQMRYVLKPDGAPTDRLRIRMANADLAYGYEYLGVPDRLVRTPLTDRCFLICTQAMAQRLGGSPYGPAGTGKTESVKALGLQLGRFTLVFNCDDTFDFQAMGRIFLGICRVGAWGCFDEFNRLEERILSAVSQQIQNIQIGLKQGIETGDSQIELAGRQFSVNANSGIFITMNPGYAGRSNLPDNLKKLFRSVAMSKPDKELIAEVMLYSQGFKNAKQLSKQTVPFFDSCAVRLSKQAHYDFGLRALKSVLVSSGGLKRTRLTSNDNGIESDDGLEPQIIVQSIRETIAPKLIQEDVKELIAVEKASFPAVQYVPAELRDLTHAIREEATAQHLVINDQWMTKIAQLYQIQRIHHGVMMVGNSGSGKSTIWKILLKALQRVEGIEGVHHVIDSKVMSKEALYGSLDSTTREWTDGLFTSILRKIVDNLRGEDAKRHWIVFDGDVDPEWVENLNSVLDDNKLLTLPNGERLNLPSNVRILFEVKDLKYATLATVSRCGMVWFSNDTVSPTMLLKNYFQGLRKTAFEDIDEETGSQAAATALPLQEQVAALLETYFDNDLVPKLLEEARGHTHIMAFTDIRALNTLFSLLNKACRNMIEYNIQHEDFPLEPEEVEGYISKKMLLALIWAMTGDCPIRERKVFGEFVAGLTTIEAPLMSEAASLIDFDVSLPKADWTPWQNQVPSVDIATHAVTQTDVVIPTLDTVRHEDVLYCWLAEHKPLVLCGPPGSGKTMTLFSALRKLPNMEVVGLNFSSATTPDLLIKSFDQYCEYRKTPNGVIMSPTQIGKWIVFFCDEINLPAADKYGTQRVISFLRQLVEQNGFWRTLDKTWVSLERVQFVGACNPPTDAGRTPLGERFLRHAPVVMVDYPGEQSLEQIYTSFNNAVLKVIPSLRGYASDLTRAMVQLYSESQLRFTPATQPHYVYSPRELSRWVRGIYEAIKPLENLSLEGLIRIWAHEALRLFQDRLVSDDERKWTDLAVKRVAMQHFPSIDEAVALKGPILFSNWLSKDYVSVEREELREFVKARLRTFCEEEVDTPIILFNDVLEHVLRIDRVFRQPQGHLILIGVSGSGKTTLSRFVAWMNGLKVFQIKVHGKYSAQDFDEDLRDVLRRSGCKGEKICFIMDESNVLESGFLERMNTLLANAEVPGLFEGDELAALMTACKEGASRQGLLLDSQEELYKWFTQQIVRNLHIVFTMNPPEDGLSSKAATSPALFNRCVLNWFGDWSDQALFQVGSELTQSVDLERPDFAAPDSIPVAYSDLSLPPSHRDAVVNSMVYIHRSLYNYNQRLLKQQSRLTFLTPRHYLDFVAQYVKLFNEKREDLEEQQRHLNIGLEKLRNTVHQVKDLRSSLAQKKIQLETKNSQANEKLQRMVRDQNETERRKTASLEVQRNLARQESEVARRKEEVNADLAKAEPAVVDAQVAVRNIKRQHLTEVRSMGNPPAGVKLALSAVCTLLGHQKADDWRAIQSAVRAEDFIASIVGYDNQRQMTKSLRTRMQNEFLAKDDFTFEKVNRASKACGPLVQWVQAQVNFSAILDRVGPLRDEAQKLEEETLQTRAEAQAIQNTITKLENSIETYKSEYAVLISETGAIKDEMEKVENKVTRSVKLLDSLSSERGRWEESSKSFETQIGTLVGDVLVAAAFLAYCGLYDQQYRKAMTDDWLNQLSLSNISHKVHNPVVEYLSSADERLTWSANGLPIDELCNENAIILERFNRYPLIIDPSGRATEFLQKQNKDRRLTITSFLDDGFIKQLESSLRFGNPILIQDAEHLDPVLNHVLNKEYQKTGGRVLIQLGKQEIDFSPAFKVYLSTRDPSASFPPDICSRTTFVNFTVTQSSLQTQSLNDVLKSERPDVDQRRTNLVKMQGEFATHLRGLERRLLQALNESRGNILDDDVVIETLETLKKEAAEISRKVAETDGVMAEVVTITKKYATIAKACSAVFAILEQLHHLNHFYQFSLQYFIDIFNTVLHGNANLAGLTDHGKRGDIILRDLFVATYQKTSRSLLIKDRITLGLLLAQASPFEMDSSLLDLVLSESVHGNDASTESFEKDALAQAQRLPALKPYLEQVSKADWQTFRTVELGEDCAPRVWEDSTSRLDQQLRTLLLVKLFRLDRFVPAAERFVAAVFGKDIFQVTEDLAEVVRSVPAASPVALTSSPGFDASYKIENLVDSTKAKCAYIAMGSNESATSAEKAINQAAATGSWVLIKNVHLAPQWVQSLEKRLGSLKPHADFRIFLSMETSPKIPVNLLRASRILMYEQPAGIRANMKDSLSTLSARATSQPREKARIYLLLSFLHAVIQERLRYAPTLGWKGFWEFNDSDYECAAFIVDMWVNDVAQDRSNVPPAKLPWELMRYLITEMYGGKIDHEDDYRQLGRLVNNFLTVNAFDANHKLVDEADGAGLLVPEGSEMIEFTRWVDRLPEREPPTYLGLPANAEKLLLVGQGRRTIENVRRVTEILEESEQMVAEAETAE